VEEAMSEAALRQCPNCGLKIVKEGGCNHMHCPCGGSLCYVCKKSNITNQHFFNSGCPHFYHTTEEQEKEVKLAEAEAKARVKRDHPEVTDNDLKIVSSSCYLKLDV
jgi:TRIAD3 protein (E3 ubiquitin-protein ligase RNF216)